MAELAARGATIHLMGIGGAGMAGLALLLQARGARVSGCDQESNATTNELESLGMNVWLGHSTEHVDGCDAVVHTSAVPLDHPELQAARSRELPVVKRSQALAELVNAGSLVAVAGTHGKTTTTALTATALETAGLDPTALVGGRIAAWGGNARIGKSDIYVVEADEYDRSFLELWPKLAVVTSVEAEHLDIYKSFDELEAAFDEFVDRVPETGKVVACADDAGAHKRLERVGARGLGYGTGEQAELRAASVEYEPDRTRFSASWRDRALGEFELALPGQHNVRNALAVIGVVLALGLEPGLVAPALASFRGVERRFQVLGEAQGIAVVDDYAHHPTEVRATLETARQVFGDRRLLVAFQPHLYSRTQAFAEEFGRALVGADVVFVTAIYPAREKPIPGVTAELVAAAAADELAAGSVHLAPDLEALAEQVRKELRAGDVLLTLGAGDVFSVAHDLVAELRRSDVDA
jgi:UDP-N-acetylmuramate--alanine ligase